MNGFVASTPTMKKLGLLLMERYGKAKFAPNELAPSYQFIMAYIFSTLEFQEQIMIEGAFQSFVQNGGEIQIVKRATRETFIDETPIPIKILKKFIYLITGIVTLWLIWWVVFFHYGAKWITETMYVGYGNHTLSQLLERKRSSIEATLHIINPLSKALFDSQVQSHIILRNIDVDTFTYMWSWENINGIWFYKDLNSVYYVFKENWVEWTIGNRLSGELIIWAHPENMKFIDEYTINNGFISFTCNPFPTKQWEACYRILY